MSKLEDLIKNYPKVYLFQLGNYCWDNKCKDRKKFKHEIKCCGDYYIIYILENIKMKG